MINYYLRSGAGFILAVLLGSPFIMLLVLLLCILPMEYLHYISTAGITLDLIAIIILVTNHLKK